MGKGLIILYNIYMIRYVTREDAPQFVPVLSAARKLAHDFTPRFPHVTLSQATPEDYLSRDTPSRGLIRCAVGRMVVVQARTDGLLLGFWTDEEALESELDKG